MDAKEVMRRMDTAKLWLTVFSMLGKGSLSLRAGGSRDQREGCSIVTKMD